MSKPVVWSIAGSDSGGGAGIQADLHALHSLGTHGCTVITTVTAQNSVKTEGLYPLTGQQIHSQLCSLLKDMPPAAIKIGLVSNAEQLKTIAAFLAAWPEDIPRPFVVWDPVLISTQNDVLSALKREDITALLTQVDLITPNQSELMMLTGRNACAEQGDAGLAESLCNEGAGAVLLTGVLNRRHGAYSDYFYSQNAQFALEHDVVDTLHDHGTGCTLSSTIAAFAAYGYPIEDCLVLAGAYVHQGLQQSHPVGLGPGPVAHTAWPEELNVFPRIRRSDLPQVTTHFQPLIEPPGLYPVVDSVEWLKRLLEMGVTTLQLRIKSQPTPLVEAAICDAIALGKSQNAQVFINDHWALAIKHGAFGVHLGQEDLATADLKAIENAGLRLGISTHSYTEILIALQYTPSYIALGHIFPTQTKSMPSQPQGVTRLARYVQLLKPTGIPTVAIGGIGLTNLDEVAQAQPDGVAVVTAITKSENAGAAVKQFTRKLALNKQRNRSQEVSDAK